MKKKSISIVMQNIKQSNDKIVLKGEMYLEPKTQKKREEFIIPEKFMIS